MQNKLDLSKTFHNGQNVQFAEYVREFSLLDHRSIFISEAITSTSAQKVVSNLLSTDAKSHDPIYIYLNSPGGEINSGFAIYDTIRFIKSPVCIINTGLCASIATIINVAVKREFRLSMPNAQFLIHQPLISGNVVGQASDLEITAKEITKTREKINRILSEECNQDLDKIKKDTLRDYWMTAKEALDYGLITKIINHKDEIPL